MQETNQSGADGANKQHPRDPLHGVKLTMILDELVQYFGWSELGYRIPIRCFTMNPSVSSSLKFLRRTPWAREKVEALYLSFKSGDHLKPGKGWAPDDDIRTGH